jgi:DNA repair protein RecN (Recombination protein N)
MLQTLTIRNYAIIDYLHLEFGPGLNVLTGETGAGKSIILDALNSILGGRIDSAMVRGGAPRALIDAVFDVGGCSDLAAFLSEMGFALEDDLLLLSREITSAGKSSARISGRPATIAQLKAVGDWLVDLHGQHEHQSLLSVPRHLDILDEWGGKEIIALRSMVAEAYQERVRLERERAELETNARERAHLIDLYRFQIHEIAEASLTPGEEEEIAGEARRLANAQRLAEIAAIAASALNGEERAGALESLGVAARCLEEGAALDDRLNPLVEALNSARYELEEAARDLTRYQDDIEYNPERLHLLEERLELIRNLKRKYGDTIEEILEYHRQTSARLDALMNSEARGQELDGAIATAVERLNALCEQLSERRRLLAADFAATVLSELNDLAMEKTRFEVQIEIGEPTAKGRDRVEFVIATNPGEPLRPLARIASGGEISRVMLAIKSAMARQEPLPTMVFDEIDVGVGGRTATVIGQKLSALARAAQVLCITHLPQIASRGDTHLYIEKQVIGDRTSVALIPLSAQERVREIARMLGGDQNAETVRKLAEEMLQAR